MKSFKKVLAAALALAMVVTAVPVTNAEAATTGVPKTKTYYAGKTYTLKLTTPSTWKSVKSTWSEKSSAVSLSSKKTKSVKVKAIKAGSATVKVKVTYKKSSKKNAKKYTKNYSCKVSVKNPSIAVSGEDVVVVGATEKLTATVKPSSAKATFTSDNEAVATVDATGTVTGVKAGDATITATAQVGTKTVTASKKVTVKTVILKDVKQTKLNTLEAVVAGKTADLKPASFAIKNQTTGQQVLVNTVSVDKVDATKVTLTTYVDLTNGNDIDVTLDGVTKTIKATDGQIASVAVDPVTIPVATETKIEAVAKDAAGVELKRFAYSTGYPANFTFSITTTKGYVAGEKLYLPEKGDTATAKVEYSTGKYDANGKSEVITSGDVTITAGDVAATTSKIALRYGKDQGKSFDDLKDNAVIAKNDVRYAAVKIVNDKNEEVSNYADYTLESANRNILLVSADALDGSKATIRLDAVDEGSTAILVKDKSGKTVETFPVTVKAERKAAKLTVDHSDFSVVTGSSLVGLNKKTVVFTLKDQYGEDMKIDAKTLSDAECIAAGSITSGVPAATKDTAKDYATKTKNTVTVDANASTVVGAYTYKVSLAGQHNENISATFTVKVQDPAKLTGAETKRLVAIDDNGFETNRIDTVINAGNVATRKDGLPVAIKFFTYKSGVAIADKTSAITNTVTGTAPNGKTITTAAVAASITTGSGVVTFTAIDGNGTTATKAPTGNYKIQVADTDGKKYETTFTVLDSQPKVTVKRVKESSEKRATVGGDYADVVNDAFEFYYEGAKLTAKAKPDVVVNTSNIYVKSVTVDVKIDDGTYNVTFTVPVDVKQYISLK